MAAAAAATLPSLAALELEWAAIQDDAEAVRVGHGDRPISTLSTFAQTTLARWNALTTAVAAVAANTKKKRDAARAERLAADMHAADRAPLKAAARGTSRVTRKRTRRGDFDIFGDAGAPELRPRRRPLVVLCRPHHGSQDLAALQTRLAARMHGILTAATDPAGVARGAAHIPYVAPAARDAAVARVAARIKRQYATALKATLAATIKNPAGAHAHADAHEQLLPRCLTHPDPDIAMLDFAHRVLTQLKHEVHAHIAAHGGITDKLIARYGTQFLVRVCALRHALA